MHCCRATRCITAATGDAFDGKEAERIGLINFAVPKSELRAKTIALAEKLMSKSPKVLRATKQAVRNVRTMDFTQSYDYLAEKGKAIRVGDKEDSYNTGLRQFLDEKSYKPAKTRSSSERCSSPEGRHASPSPSSSARRTSAARLIASPADFIVTSHPRRVK